MAWSRSPRGRRRGRFFRRRRSRFRPTTEQGSRLERCHFNFGIDQVVSPTGGPSSDGIMLIGGASLIDALAVAGPEAQAVGRLLQNPLRAYQVEALIFDCEAYIEDATVDESNFLQQTLQCGAAVYTQRLDNAFAPTNLPSYWLSQWPVNQSTGITSQFNEDADYATRTHFQRTFTLAPHLRILASLDPAFFIVAPGWPRFRFTQRVRVKRRLPDTYGLFFGAWNFQDGGAGIQVSSIQWRVTGSLWYRMNL